MTIKNLISLVLAVVDRHTLQLGCNLPNLVKTSAYRTCREWRDEIQNSSSELRTPTNAILHRHYYITSKLKRQPLPLGSTFIKQRHIQLMVRSLDHICRVTVSETKLQLLNYIETKNTCNCAIAFGKTKKSWSAKTKTFHSTCTNIRYIRYKLIHHSNGEFTRPYHLISPLTLSHFNYWKLILKIVFCHITYKCRTL